MKTAYIFVNIALFLLLAPLFEGIIRKLTARVQSRQGPPVYQPYLDILKLLGKETINSADNWGFKIAPVMAFASIISVIAFLPLGSRANALSGYADVITVIYLLTLGGVSILLGALSSRNTFAMIGASREMVTMIMVEPVLAMTFILGAVKVKSLGIDATVFSVGNSGYNWSVFLMLAVYLLALQAFVGRQPFDIAEAEIEILEGPLVEYSGPGYGLFKYTKMLKQMFYAALFVAVFLPGFNTGFYAADLAIQVGFIALVFVFIALIGATNPRLRIDQAIRYYSVMILLALCAVGLSAYGI
ncbi:MAG: NADH-quinone oxidoreductase subunit H [Spirochaetes bacterium]|jgi:formate hydrogenlyase subunit 4|nr:NADH-quinone oxidoreductase subunit H [Spirochaetota bacterium]